MRKDSEIAVGTVKASQRDGVERLQILLSCRVTYTYTWRVTLAKIIEKRQEVRGCGNTLARVSKGTKRGQEGKDQCERHSESRIIKSSMCLGERKERVKISLRLPI